MNSGVVLLVVLGLVLLGLVGYLVTTVFRGSPDVRSLPLLVEVGDTAAGVLACPVCRGASFAPPRGSGFFFALALGPFVIGSLAGSSSTTIACVTCGSHFRRGRPTRSSPELSAQAGLREPA